MLNRHAKKPTGQASDKPRNRSLKKLTAWRIAPFYLETLERFTTSRPKSNKTQVVECLLSLLPDKYVRGRIDDLLKQQQQLKVEALKAKGIL